MKYIVFMIIFVAGSIIWAWDTVDEMESDIVVALTNNSYLVSATFTDQLNSATNSALVEMKTDAYLLLSLTAFQNFLNTAEGGWLCREMFNASNAVEAIGIHSNKWQYWMARFTYASAQISQQHFSSSYSTLTNALEEIARTGYVSADSDAERAILHKYEMPDLNIVDAMKVFAGMAAAELGMGNVATNYANQVPMPYRNKIHDFVR